MMKFQEELEKTLKKEQILIEEPMSRHTTFRVGGNAKYFVMPQIDEVEEIIKLCRIWEMPYVIVGNGSNLLVSDEGIDGVVIELKSNAQELTVAGTLLEAQAGVLLSKLAATACQHGLSGLEFAAGIPGTLGGALVMNAGAYGGEIKDVLVSVEVLTKTGEIRELPADKLELSYRHSCIEEQGYVVLSARLQLKEAPKDTIRSRMEELAAKRKEKQPLEYPSAGSTFKRPEGYFAAKLIEDAGLKGYTVGGACVSEKHSGFVVNTGNATADDIRRLITDVQQKVWEQFGVRLEPEVKLIGNE